LESQLKNLTWWVRWVKIFRAISAKWRIWLSDHIQNELLHLAIPYFDSNIMTALFSFVNLLVDVFLRYNLRKERYHKSRISLNQVSLNHISLDRESIVHLYALFARVLLDLSTATRSSGWEIQVAQEVHSQR
jgi:hypothetical protein